MARCRAGRWLGAVLAGGQVPCWPLAGGSAGGSTGWWLGAVLAAGWPRSGRQRVWCSVAGAHLTRALTQTSAALWGPHVHGAETGTPGCPGAFAFSAPARKTASSRGSTPGPPTTSSSARCRSGPRACTHAHTHTPRLAQARDAHIAAREALTLTLLGPRCSGAPFPAHGGTWRQLRCFRAGLPCLLGHAMTTVMAMAMAMAGELLFCVGRRRAGGRQAVLGRRDGQRVSPARLCSLLSRTGFKRCWRWPAEVLRHQHAHTFTPTPTPTGTHARTTVHRSLSVADACAGQVWDNGTVTVSPFSGQGASISPSSEGEARVASRFGDVSFNNVVRAVDVTVPRSATSMAAYVSPPHTHPPPPSLSPCPAPPPPPPPHTPPHSFPVLPLWQ